MLKRREVGGVYIALREGAVRPTTRDELSHYPARRLLIPELHLAVWDILPKLSASGWKLPTVNFSHTRLGNKPGLGHHSIINYSLHILNFSGSFHQLIYMIRTRPRIIIHLGLSRLAMGSTPTARSGCKFNASSCRSVFCPLPVV